jgi:hypothetical protein
MLQHLVRTWLLLILALGTWPAVAHAAGSKKPAHKAAKPSVKQAAHGQKPGHGSDGKHAKGKAEGKAKKASDKKGSVDKRVANKKGSVDKKGTDKKADKKATDRKGKSEDDGDSRAVKEGSAKDKKKRAALAKTCATGKAKKTAQCKAFFADEKERAQAAEHAALKKTCALAKNKKSKQCKKFQADERKSAATSGACGRKYGIAKKNEKVPAFAHRFHVAEARLRDWNDLGSASKLKGGKRYLVFKSPHDGVTLQGGVLLEAEPDVFAMQRPYRGWGKPVLVDTLRLAIHQVLDAAPEGTTLVLGDLSKEGGGCLAPHKSHRGGLDADVGFFYRGAQQRRWLGLATADSLDADRTWLLIKAMLATGRLQMAFLDYNLQPTLYEAALRAGETPQTLEPIFQYPRPIERAHETVIRHLGGHDNHMHVRLICPSDSECPLPDDARARMTSVRMEQRGGVMDEGRRGAVDRHGAIGAVPGLMQ